MTLTNVQTVSAGEGVRTVTRDVVTTLVQGGETVVTAVPTTRTMTAVVTASGPVITNGGGTAVGSVTGQGVTEARPSASGGSNSAADSRQSGTSADVSRARPSSNGGSVQPEAQSAEGQGW